MAGLGEVLRLLLEKSWTLGLLLLVTGGAAWYAGAHGQRMPPVAEEWAPLAAMLGCALIVLSFVNAVLAKTGAFFTSRSAAFKDAFEAVENLQTLNIAEFHALAEALETGLTRISIDHTSILAGVWRKGLLTSKRQESGFQSICEVHPGILAVKESIIAQWEKDLREGRRPDPPEELTTWMGR